MVLEPEAAGSDPAGLTPAAAPRRDGRKFREMDGDVNVDVERVKKSNEALT